MPNPQYIKGRKKEYKIVKELKEQGCQIAQRSAGSHSPVDVFAVNLDKKEIILIQSKPEGYRENKYKEFIERLNGEFKVKFEIR